MAIRINKSDGIKIGAKLKCESREGGRHTIYKVCDDNGVRITQFGVTRHPDKDGGHDWIPRDLKCSSEFAKGLADCPKSRNDYLAIVRDGRRS